MPYISFLTSSFARETLFGLKICGNNGLLEKLRPVWKANSKVLVICAHPDLHQANDHIPMEVECIFAADKLSVSSVEVCDDRNPEIVAERIKDVDVLFFTGGTTSKQNALMQSAKLKENLADFSGIVIGWSAGAMNCTEYVYPMPKIEGETAEPDEIDVKCFPGLDILHGMSILPHFECKYLSLSQLPPSVLAAYFEHEIIGLIDGSWILVDGDTATLYGEGYRIKDGEIKNICLDGETLELYSKHKE